MFAKKSLGQNFLTSAHIAEAVAMSANLGPEDRVLEIGPGKGILTEALLKRAGEVIAVEKDRRLIPALQEKFKQAIKSRKLKIIEGDILKFDASLLHGYKIVANIPYNITGELLRLFLSSAHQPKSMTLMVQKEVAERIMAKEGESILSLSVKAYGEPKLVRKVSAGSFSPKPKVDSAILHIGNISRYFFTNTDEKRFFALLKAGFAHKRKLLWSNVGNIESKFKLELCFESLGRSRNARAEELSLQDWQKLTNCLT